MEKNNSTNNTSSTNKSQKEDLETKLRNDTAQGSSGSEKSLFFKPSQSDELSMNPLEISKGDSCSLQQNLPRSAIRNEQSLHNWQASKKTLKERLEFVLQKQLQTDVQFIIGKGDAVQKIAAHKFVLSIGSAVFDSMFNSMLATKEDQIEIPDVVPEAFSALMRFLYTDDVVIGPETVMTTLYAAKKYAVPSLEARCVDFLKSNLDPHNAFMLLTQARLFDEPQLASLCLGCIDQNTKEALNADGFTDIDIETLQRVLKRDTLGGLRECHLFKAVERWADAECGRQKLGVTRENRRKVLGETINLVRFPLMSIEEFANGPAQSGTLEDREIVDMFLYFTLNPKPAVRFSEMPRCAMNGKEYTICRFTGVAERWGYSGTSDTIRFTTSHKVYIVGFGLYGATMGPTSYEVDIELKSFENQHVLGKNSSTFRCDGSQKTFRVLFRHPVEIKPEFPYIASATINGQESFYGTGGRRRVQKELVSRGGLKVSFSFNYVKGNNNGTSVDDGQIPEIIFYV